MPPAFLSPIPRVTATRAAGPLSCILPLPFPLYSQFGLYALPLHSTRAVRPTLVSATSATPTFTAPLLLIWQK